MTTARVQQAVVVAAVGAALLWCVWCWRQGLGPGWWALGLLLALAPQAPVLALEFVVLAVLGRDAAVPRPSKRQLLRAWWGEVVVAWQVFGWRQPFAANREPDVPGQWGRTGVVLLHGYICNRGLWAPWLRQLRAAGVPCTAITMNPPFGSIDSYQPAIDAAVQDLIRSTGRPPLLVGHSMGGLSARAWLAGQPDAAAADSRVAGVVTIGTPHQGTWAAQLGMSTNARQMRIGSRWLAALAGREPAARRARFTCFYGHADNLVFPASQGMLAGADNRHLAGVAHVAMLFEPAVLAEVLRRVQAQDGLPVPGRMAGQQHG